MKHVLGACCLGLLVTAGDAQAIGCIEGARVASPAVGQNSVGIGDIREHYHGKFVKSDVASDVVFNTDQPWGEHRHLLNVGMNLNDPQGEALHAMLLLSKVGGYRINAADKNNIINCVDVDEIWISQ
jgi:hypothetical protein